MTGRNQIEPPSEQVTVEWRAKHVVFLEIHRPPDNYFDAELIRDLADHLERLEEHAECRAIVLASEGRNFCAGALLGSVPPPDPARIYGEAVRLFAGTKPIVAAVQGAAVGGGLGLALMADFRVASAESRFSANFSRLGYFPGFGLTGLLPRLVGEQAALELLYTGARIGGERAHQLGLCDRLVPNDRIRPEAESFAEDIAASAPLAVAKIRRHLRGHLAEAVARATERELSEQLELATTADFAEGVQATSERRIPNFVGH